MKRLAVVALAGLLSAGAAFGARSLFSPPKELVQFGYVGALTPQGKAYKLRFDPALWLQGETANRAAQADGVIRPGETVPNDYYIRNPDHKLLTYKLPASAHVTVLDQLKTTKISVPRLALLLKTSKPCGRFALRPPCRLGFWMRYSIDTVRALDQQYQP
jgi:hypothetical protein